MSEAARAWIYRLLVVAIFALGVFGVITQEEAAAWIGTAGGLLGVVLATANTSTKKGADQ
jgi:hypothetical protein